MEEIGKEALLKLIEFIEGASPHLWLIVKRQVIVAAMQYLIWATLSAVASIAIYSVWHEYDKADRNKERDRYDSPYSHTWNLLILAGLELTPVSIFIAAVISAISRFINPEFYAIKWLIEMFAGN